MWATIGQAMCEGCTSETEEDRFTRLYASSLERLGHLLVQLAEPVHEAIDEIASLPPQQQGTGDITCDKDRNTS